MVRIREMYRRLREAAENCDAFMTVKGGVITLECESVSSTHRSIEGAAAWLGEEAYAWVMGEEAPR